MSIIGYHTCELEFAKMVVERGVKLSESSAEYEWLGTGTYFWMDNISRAKEWKGARKKIAVPAILKAEINLGFCLNINDSSCHSELSESYELIKTLCDKAGTKAPENTDIVDGIALKRKLDATVIDFTHMMRRTCGYRPYDTVVGIFEEGESIFPGSALKKYSHIQVAVKNYSCISRIELIWSSES